MFRCTTVCAAAVFVRAAPIVPGRMRRAERGDHRIVECIVLGSSVLWRHHRSSLCGPLHAYRCFTPVSRFSTRLLQCATHLPRRCKVWVRHEHGSWHGVVVQREVGHGGGRGAQQAQHAAAAAPAGVRQHGRRAEGVAGAEGSRPVGYGGDCAEGEGWCRDLLVPLD